MTQRFELPCEQVFIIGAEKELKKNRSCRGAGVARLKKGATARSLFYCACSPLRSLYKPLSNYLASFSILIL